MVKVLCVGDSLGLPRDGVTYENTWFYKIKIKYPNYDFIYKFKRSLTSLDLVGKSKKDYLGDYSLYYRPDVVIVQVGICDCAPRYINDTKPFWMGLKFLFRKLRMEGFFWYIIKKTFTRGADSVYVPFNDFRNNIIGYVDILKSLKAVKHIVFVKIGIPGASPRKSSPNLLNNILRYNKVFDEMQQLYPGFVDVVDPLCVEDDKYYVDGYHTNSIGADLVYSQLSSKLGNYSL